MGHAVFGRAMRKHALMGPSCRNGPALPGLF
jgi:hypothetical protein